MPNGYNPQKSKSESESSSILPFLFLILFIGLLFLVGWYFYSDSKVSNCSDYYKQQTSQEWSDCKAPGGKQNASKCTCSCNPGYSGVNCQTKSKHVTDLENCKGKPDCANCLKNNISQKLSGNGSDVQQFKDDFISSITAINNICCQNNCSNTSGTTCDKCVSDNMEQLPSHIKSAAYFMNNKGCISFKITNQPQNFIAKKSICNDKNTDPCFPNPCKHGLCVATNNSYKCKCLLNFDGPTCSRSCRTKAPNGNCRDIKDENLCKYFYNSDNDKCTTTWYPGYKCSKYGGDVGSEKCS
ncbi:hypothetical protein N8569_00605 [bacterium]|nr:hypothetical protein [bacterium]